MRVCSVSRAAHNAAFWQCVGSSCRPAISSDNVHMMAAFKHKRTWQAAACGSNANARVWGRRCVGATARSTVRKGVEACRGPQTCVCGNCKQALALQYCGDTRKHSYCCVVERITSGGPGAVPSRRSTEQVQWHQRHQNNKSNQEGTLLQGVCQMTCILLVVYTKAHVDSALVNRPCPALNKLRSGASTL